MTETTTSTPTGYTFSYLRVSSLKQSFERQVAAIDAYRDEQGQAIPEERRFSDKLSGKSMDRPGLNAMLAQARPGDVVIVSSLDRLGRTVLHTLTTIDNLESRGITVKSLKAGEDFEGHTGKLVRLIMAGVAEWERINTAERAAEARAARKAKDEAVGRGKSKLKPETVRKVHDLKADGKGATDIANTLEMSRQSVYRALSMTP